MCNNGITSQIYLVIEPNLTYIIVVILQTRIVALYLPKQLNGRLWDENVSKTTLNGGTLYNHMELFFKMQI